MNNKVMMQFFEWYMPADSTLWKKAKSEAKKLKNMGITYLWLPPAYKGCGGVYDVGYGVYDLYDLGEFDQKGTIPTKYGLKSEYLEAIQELHENGIKVLGDIVFNHKMGADEAEEVIATEEMNSDRNIEIQKDIKIKAWTKFYFPGRNGTYSDFCWNWTHFHGSDWDDYTQKSGIYRFYGKHWDKDVDDENGNYDYLMGVDIDLNNVDVVKELVNWTKWYLETCNVDGFRLDAIKHIRADFYSTWIEEITKDYDKTLYIIGEYWKNDVSKLKAYLDELLYQVSLFDVPLHYNFYTASQVGEEYDMRTILDNSLVKIAPQNAVTFVDNHDTEPNQPLESYVRDWFKPLAYSIVLLRNEGMPCVFYGDYYGVNIEWYNPIKETLDLFLKVRMDYCYGKQNDYFDNEHVIGWTMEGDNEHPNSGVAVLMSNKDDGVKNMYMGEKFIGCEMYDITGNITDTIRVNEDGNAEFRCNGGKVSIWIKK